MLDIGEQDQWTTCKNSFALDKLLLMLPLKTIQTEHAI